MQTRFLVVLIWASWISVSAQDLTELAERVRPAVVLIQVMNSQGSVQGTGTGFLVDAEGTIATNHHVVKEASRVRIRYADQTTEVLAGYLSFDEAHDLAILKAEQAPEIYVPIADFSQVKQGQEVVVYGNPQGLEGVISKGIISALRLEGEVPEKFKDELDFLPEVQITAATSPGSSGSPIVNLDGEVIGVHMLKIQGGDNLNFAIAVTHLEMLLKNAPDSVTPFASMSSRWMNIVISMVLFVVFAYGIWWLLPRMSD